MNKSADETAPGTAPRCLFRELESDRFVEINPSLVRFLRTLDHGTEIVFSEAHSIKVKASRPAVSNSIDEVIKHRLSA